MKRGGWAFLLGLSLLSLSLFCGNSAQAQITPAQPADPNQAIPAQPLHPLAPIQPLAPVTNAAPTTNATPPAPAPLVIAADTSLKGVISELAQTWADNLDSSPQVKLELANAGTLRSQVDKDADWDVVISSDVEDIQSLIDSGKLEGIHPLARNALVIFGRHPLIRDDDLDWYDLIGPEWKRIVLGDPESVGSGRAAVRALQKHNLWGDKLKELYHFAPSETIALQMAQNVDAIILYKTDVKDQSYPGYEVFPISPEDAPPIVYSAAVLKRSNKADLAKAFIDFCASDAARPIWVKHGFDVN